MQPDDLLPQAARYRLSMAIRAAAELGVADHLGDDPRFVDELAGALGVHAPTLKRLLRALASEGIFVETADGRFAINPAGAQLRSGAKREFIVGWSSWQPTYEAFGFLADAVRTGTPAFELAHGVGFEDYMRANPPARAAYDRANESTAEAFQTIVDGHDYSRFGRVADIGGGTGAFMTRLLGKYPRTLGIVFDLPAVVAGVSAPPELSGRLSFVAGDFFRDSLPSADLYTLVTVLRLFPDADAQRLVNRVAAAMGPDATVIIVDFCHPDGPMPPRLGLADLQAMCAYGGRDRSRADFVHMFDEAGLELTEITPIASYSYIVGELKSTA